LELPPDTYAARAAAAPPAKYQHNNQPATLLANSTCWQCTTNAKQPARDESALHRQQLRAKTEASSREADNHQSATTSTEMGCYSD
jgi:hypothetical protein